ncbi:hypothetical protein EJ05DRAFT_519538 [Pseudovirgaria hyperparasitica]|uniref:Uncharacterized protein n=1 Tax=Pseudovirgaria hyperparasitica TaxID=470096 RepID=A0A6A6W0Y2_9PEZI|nr:uncharacterized protein EJ05DRAFT_519538 [Pseudovirgaria hyperparasitica]KAF2755756.1 hypothetical protein EJ05DRAFT_519538 [Pseudovirgaria hyperparasitica]
MHQPGLSAAARGESRRKKTRTAIVDMGFGKFVRKGSDGDGGEVMVWPGPLLPTLDGFRHVQAANRVVCPKRQAKFLDHPKCSSIIPSSYSNHFDHGSDADTTTIGRDESSSSRTGGSSFPKEGLYWELHDDSQLDTLISFSVLVFSMFNTSTSSDRDCWSRMDLGFAVRIKGTLILTRPFPLERVIKCETICLTEYKGQVLQGY